jgi:hypothetical protein
MMKYAVVLAIAFLLATQSHFAWSAFDPPQGKLAAPFSPGTTIYRPDCWIKEDPNCDGVRP